MTKKSSAHYQREYRKRLREQGLVKKEVWVLPENNSALHEFEKELRKPRLNGNVGTDIGEQKMKENATNRWNTETLFAALKGLPGFSTGRCSIEMIDGIDASIVISMHEYGDLPVFVTAGGDQILVEAVLFSTEDIIDTSKFNEYVLKTHKYLPLSTISIDTDPTHGDYYHMFGALSSMSSISEVVQEIDTLADNVIQATEAFSTFLKS